MATEKRRKYALLIIAALLILILVWWYLTAYSQPKTTRTNTTTSTPTNTTTSTPIQFPAIPSGVSLAYLPDYVEIVNNTYVIEGLVKLGDYVTVSVGFKASPGTQIGINYKGITVPLFGIASKNTVIDVQGTGVQIHADTNGGYVYYPAYDFAIALRYVNISGYNIWIPMAPTSTIQFPTSDVIYATSLFPLSFNKPVLVVENTGIQGTGYLPVNVYKATTTGNIKVTVNLSP